MIMRIRQLFTKKSISLLVIAALLAAIFLAAYSFADDRDPYEELYAVLDEAITPRSSDYREEFPVPVDWRLEGETNVTVILMHSFRFLDDLYISYVNTGSETAKDTIIQYMCDYLDYGDERTQDIYYAWNDDSVARRVYRLAYWTYHFQEDIPADYLSRMTEELAYQAELLTDPDFYNWNHNHGMYQDLGLIAYALFWAEDETRSEYLQLAMERSEGYFDYVFTEEGVHKEHSPQYGYDIAQCLLIYGKAYEEFSPAFAEKCVEIYEGCGDYFAVIAMPDWRIPSLGDSPYFSLDEGRWTDNPWYQYVASGGAAGEEPPCNYVFPESGYAVMRSSWEGSPEDATYLLFAAATYSSAHKHSDDLGFILYHGGDLFVEAGKKDYDYTDEQTSYTYSNYGHNVMLVNGEGFPVVYAESGAQRIASADLETACATQITGYDMEADVKWVQGIQYRYSNATQVRTIAYDKDANIAQITDQVAATEQLEAQFLYHIAEGVEVQEQEKGWSLLRDGVVVAHVYVESECPIELETITDSAGSAPYYTTYYGSTDSPKQGSLLIVTMNCAEGNNEVSFTVELSPQSGFAEEAPMCGIDRESSSAVFLEVEDRPYGPFYISAKLTGNTLQVENTYSIENATYAWEIYAEDQETRITNTKYSEDSSWSYTFTEPGTYYIKAWIQMESGGKLSSFSKAIEVPN